MLSRTADHLYWMSRYIERAESLARLVDAHYRMSLLPHSAETLETSLTSTMTALYMAEPYLAKHKTVAPRLVFEFVTLDRDYSGSIFSCLRAARENARAVRGSLTSELWETLNSTWLEARSIAARSVRHADIGQFVEWVKERSHLTRGVMIGTMLRDEAFHFSRIGTFLERADSTARILTAHQNDLKPDADASSVPDPFAWSVLLRALSAFEVYRRVYRDVITPFKVAQLLILRDDMPRSLVRCCKEVYSNLRSVANEQSAETERRAGEMHAMLHFTRMEAIGAEGLPSFLEQFLAKLRDLGDRVASDFLGPARRGIDMQMHIRHETHYRYERPVKYSVQSLHLTPRRDPSQRALNWSISAPGRRLEQVDAYGNISHLLTIDEPHREIQIVVHGVVETADTEGRQDDGPLSPLAYLAPTNLTKPDAALRAFAQSAVGAAATAQERAHALADAVFGAVRYKSGTSDVQDSAATAFKSGEGVCQDHAHVYIASARSLGIPTRYVSGYLFTGDKNDAASHAWVDVWLGAEAGWQSIDVTHKRPAVRTYCRLAVGRDYLDAAPVRGVRQGGGGEKMEASVLVAESAQQQQQ